jgi:hypothetical protein
VTLTDWLLSLHVLSAVALVGGLAALWAVALATRPAGAEAVSTAPLAIARPLSAVVGVGMVGTLVFGIWLAIDSDDYAVWDPWIVAALVLWLVGGGLGDRSGRAFAEVAAATDAREPWRRGALLHAGSSIAALIILALMIWKPGA